VKDNDIVGKEFQMSKYAISDTQPKIRCFFGISDRVSRNYGKDVVGVVTDIEVRRNKRGDLVWYCHVYWADENKSRWMAADGLCSVQNR
jgi:NADPH:quinone reductase-like Zn-dependent oxidoreductase